MKVLQLSSSAIILLVIASGCSTRQFHTSALKASTAHVNQPAGVHSPAPTPEPSSSPIALASPMPTLQDGSATCPNLSGHYLLQDEAKGDLQNDLTIAQTDCQAITFTYNSSTPPTQEVWKTNGLPFDSSTASQQTAIWSNSTLVYNLITSSDLSDQQVVLYLNPSFNLVESYAGQSASDSLIYIKQNQ